MARTELKTVISFKKRFAIKMSRETGMWLEVKVDFLGMSER
jgi:hypothetical protein